MPSSVDLPWLILDISHPPDQSPWVEAALNQMGFEGWEVHREIPETLWRLYFPMESTYQQRLSQLKAELAAAGATVAEAGQIRDEDWAENWKEFYHPFPVGERLVISPSWEDPPREMRAGREVIRLDPGSAFGTGYHESTRLCLQAMESLTHDPSWGSEPLLDYGCGSGILAIGALLLGAPRVVASDRDPVAVEVSTVNLKENGFQDDRFQVTRADLPSGDPFPFVVANLTADILCQLCRPLLSVCSDHLVLGGIVEKRAGKVLDAFTEEGARLVKKRQENDWVSYHFRTGRS